MLKTALNLATLALYVASVFVIVDFNFWAGIALFAAATCIRYYLGNIGKLSAISESTKEKTAAND